MSAQLAHLGHNLAELALILAVPGIYVTQRLVRRAIARLRGTPWPPPPADPDDPSRGRGQEPDRSG